MLDRLQRFMAHRLSPWRTTEITLVSEERASHDFSTKALLEQECIVMNRVNVFSQKMQEFAKGDGIVDVMEWFAYTTFDVIGDMALGEPFGCLHNGQQSLVFFKLVY